MILFLKFNWIDYIVVGMFGNHNNSKSRNESLIIPMVAEEPILVDDWDYLANATQLYGNYVNNNKKTLKNFLLWVVLKDRIGVLPKKFREVKLDFDKVKLF